MKIGYVRVSSVDQNEERQLVTMKKHEVEKIFIEKVSCKDKNRPKLQELLGYVREGDTVIIHDLSRLARNTKDLLEIVEYFNKNEVALVSDKEYIDSNTATSVDSNKTKKITGGTKKVTVSGLTEPTILTTEDVEKHIVLKFEGVSGKGFGKPENTFPSPLNTINFSVQNNGTLKNGGTISLELTETAEEKLNAEGYVLDKDFNPSYTVKDLKVVAFSERFDSTYSLETVIQLYEGYGYTEVE